MSEMSVEMFGDGELRENLLRLPEILEPNVEMAGTEFAGEILETEGVQVYPPATDANREPEPYYIRGRGMQQSPGYNDLRSEQYGMRFSVEAEGYRTEVGNAASYAEHIGGVGQAVRMGLIGWRRLIDVAHEKAAIGVEIYKGWIERALKLAGLK